MLSQLSSVKDQKIANIHKFINDLHAKLKSQLDILKKKDKFVDDNCYFRTASSSAMPAYAQEPLYGIADELWNLLSLQYRFLFTTALNDLLTKYNIN